MEVDCLRQIKSTAGGSPGLVVMGGEAHIPKVVGSNLGTIYWMDMTFFTMICCKNFNDVCLKRPNINEKEAGVGPIFFKKVQQNF